MGCFGKNKGHIDESAKWAYINLDDFHATSSWSPFSYLTVWFFALVGIAVFAVDCFTAVNLLILDKWSSQIKPAIDLKYSKWIFVGCIMFSFALYAYEWLRAIRVIRRGGVAESYMDPLAVQLQCMRGKGWKRFLVFASLTKSRKGTDYIAFFVYFQFNSAIRILIAEGGRQVINALTIISVAKADLVPIGAHAAKDDGSPVIQFFLNVAALWNASNEQAIVLFSMCFTLFIWVFSALCLLAALILYLVFLWHYIPQSDGRLSVYCRRKVDRRLEKIVEKKVQAAIEEAERKRHKEEAKAAGSKNDKPGKGGAVPGQIARQPTLPQLDKFDEEKNSGFGLTKTDTMATLPPYSSRPPTRNENPTLGIQRQPTLPDLGVSANMPPRPQRQNTNMSNYSNQSYASNASLLHNANDMGYDSRPESPIGGPPPFERQLSSSSSLGTRPPPARTMTNSSMGSQRSYGAPPPSQRFPVRSSTGLSSNDDRSPSSRTGSAMSGGGFGPPQRSYTAGTYTIPEQPSREETPVSNYTASVYSQATNAQNRQPSRQSFNRPFSNENRPHFDSRSPPPINERISPLSAGTGSTPSPVNGQGSGYVAFNPYNRAPSVPATAHQSALRRNVTNPVELQPMASNQDYFNARPLQRSATAPIDQNGYTPSPSQYDNRY
ncbi:putative vacuolar membrane protein-1 [Elsinoe australis]|uniref:Putative vacuolar membrane protein-1 n=1 Tax=Elsinoe australis TaxID=40998 RepID=A0A4U7B9N5_9PEZI|nr:putative vacuolar membrane protein-1 [Elsinoe australis]